VLSADRIAAERVAVYEIMADCHFNLGDYDAAVGHYEQAMEISQQQGWSPTISQLLLGLGKVARRRGNYAQARAHARESLDLCREIGHIGGEASSLGILGDVAYNRGDLEQAITHYEQSLSTFRQIGDPHGIADYCLSLAFVKIDQEEIDEAEDYLREALAIGRSIDAALVLIRAKYHLARVARARGDLDKAQADAKQVIEAAQQAGVRLLEALGHHLAGEVMAQRRQSLQAENHMVEALRQLEMLGDRFETAWALRSYARLLADRGDRSRARAQLQHASVIFAELGSQRELTRTHAELARL
jgi:tetratricopeptide (TPR) repeat protein